MKILVFSLVTVVLFAPPVELVSRFANAWDVASILPRLFGTAPIENLIYAFFNFFWPLAFYEVLIDKDTTRKISKRFRFLVGLYILLSVVVYTLYVFDQSKLPVNYWIVGVAILIPSIIIYVRNPKLLPKVIVPTVFFGAVFFLHEVVSLIIGHWWWPGEYLLPVSLWGRTFPLDDAIIWYFLSTPALIGGYEFFVDDNE